MRIALMRIARDLLFLCSQRLVCPVLDADQLAPAAPDHLKQVAFWSNQQKLAKARNRDYDFSLSEMTRGGLNEQRPRSPCQFTRPAQAGRAPDRLHRKLAHGSRARRIDVSSEPERPKMRFLAPFPRKPLIRLKSRSGIAIFCTFLQQMGSVR